MRVEACCNALLKEILPAIAPQRTGYCIDVGVGTFAFYCELFARLGFASVAVEPLPEPRLRRLCATHNIQLIETCLSDHSGYQPLYRGRLGRFRNANFSSLSPDWFGASAQTQQVSTINLAGLIQQVKAASIACLKLDIEGWEGVVIRQLPGLPLSQLPRLLMFEYGGGSSRQKGAHGWSKQFFEATTQSLNLLKACGYGLAIKVDYAAGTKAQVFNLQDSGMDFSALFPPGSVYGNLICFQGCSFSELAIADICKPYSGGLVNWIVGKLVSA